jgi:formate/nitrite transporter FocA (FNT family)
VCGCMYGPWPSEVCHSSVTSLRLVLLSVTCGKLAGLLFVVVLRFRWSGHGFSTRLWHDTKCNKLHQTWLNLALL